MPRKSTVAELQAEEAAVPSPLRRSSRRTSTTQETAPTPAPTTPARATRGRRASAAQDNDEAAEVVASATPARATRGRRASATQEVKEVVETKPAAAQNRRASLLAEEETKATTPSRRGRKLSTSAELPVVESDDAEKPKSVRGRRTSTTSETNLPDAPEKPASAIRGRRKSASVEPTTEITELSVKAANRATKRRTSTTSELEPAEEAAPAKRTTRARKASEHTEQDTAESVPTLDRRGRKSSNASETEEQREKKGASRRRSSENADVDEGTSKSTARKRITSTDLVQTPKTPGTSRLRRNSTKSESDTEILELNFVEEDNNECLSDNDLTALKDNVSRLTPVKKKKVLEPLVTELDLSVINESVDDAELSKQGDVLGESATENDLTLSHEIDINTEKMFLPSKSNSPETLTEKDKPLLFKKDSPQIDKVSTSGSSFASTTSGSFTSSSSATIAEVQNLDDYSSASTAVAEPIKVNGDIPSPEKSNLCFKSPTLNSVCDTVKATTPEIKTTRSTRRSKSTTPENGISNQSRLNTTVDSSSLILVDSEKIIDSETGTSISTRRNKSTTPKSLINSRSRSNTPVGPSSLVPTESEKIIDSETETTILTRQSKLTTPKSSHLNSPIDTRSLKPTESEEISGSITPKSIRGRSITPIDPNSLTPAQSEQIGDSTRRSSRLRKIKSPEESPIQNKASNINPSQSHSDETNLANKSLISEGSDGSFRLNLNISLNNTTVHDKKEDLDDSKESQGSNKENQESINTSRVTDAIGKSALSETISNMKERSFCEPMDVDQSVFVNASITSITANDNDVTYFDESINLSKETATERSFLIQEESSVVFHIKSNSDQRKSALGKPIRISEDSSKLHISATENQAAGSFSQAFGQIKAAQMQSKQNSPVVEPLSIIEVTEQEKISVCGPKTNNIFQLFDQKCKEISSDDEFVEELNSSKTAKPELTEFSKNKQSESDMSVSVKVNESSVKVDESTVTGAACESTRYDFEVPPSDDDDELLESDNLSPICNSKILNKSFDKRMDDSGVQYVEKNQSRKEPIVHNNSSENIEKICTTKRKSICKRMSKSPVKALEDIENIPNSLSNNKSTTDIKLKYDGLFDSDTEEETFEVASRNSLTKSTKLNEKKTPNTGSAEISSTISNEVEDSKLLSEVEIVDIKNDKDDQDNTAEENEEDEINNETDEESLNEEDNYEENEFIDGMAEEAEEDTPSEGSNDIVDDGESIGSLDSEEQPEDEYENDSFVCDDEEMEKLSGEEYDLDDNKKEKPKKVKKSRIINVDQFDENEIITIPSRKQSEEQKSPKQRIRIITVSDSSEDEATTIPKETKTDDLEINDKLDKIVDKVKEISKLEIEKTIGSLETTFKQVEDGESVICLDLGEQAQSKIVESAIQIKVCEEETGVLNQMNQIKDVETSVKIDCPANFNVGEKNTSSKRIRKSSINIHESLVLDGSNDKLSKRINSLVDTFCHSVQGEVSLNLSLEFEDKKSSSQIPSHSNSPSKGINIISDIKITPGREYKEDSKPSCSKDNRECKDPRKRLISSFDKTEDSSEKTSPKKRMSVTLSDIEVISPVKESPNKRKRLSKSLENISHTSKDKKKLRKRKNKQKRFENVQTRNDSAENLKHATSNLINDLVTDVKNRPRRTIKPTTPNAELNSSWIISPARNIKPSKREKIQPTALKFHPKDFKNQILSDTKRVHRVDTHTLLKKKGIY